MKCKKFLLPGLMLLALSALLLPGCTSAEEEEEGPSQEEIRLQAELDALQAEYDDLSADYEVLEEELAVGQPDCGELNEKYDELSAQNSQLSAQYDELLANYDELSAKYDALTAEPAAITEEEVEQAIFNRINQERMANGVSELEWDLDLHWWAKQHSDQMRDQKTLDYNVADQKWWFDVFRGASYGSPEKIAEGALTLWQDNLHYEKTFLSDAAKYSAVAVSKSGDVFYATFFAAIEL